jgi:hypothetical protein
VARQSVASPRESAETELFAVELVLDLVMKAAYVSATTNAHFSNCRL